MIGRRAASPSWRTALLALALALVASPVGCSKKAAQEEQTKTVVYTVRGRIVQTPRADSPASELHVRHEEIPSFLHSWPDGAVGMKAMVMPFPLAEGVSLEGLGAGDPVELTFEVTYALPGGAVAGYRATGVEPLPEGTRLAFDEPPADE